MIQQFNNLRQKFCMYLHKIVYIFLSRMCTCRYSTTTWQVIQLIFCNVTVLWREEGYTMKYCLSPRKSPRAQPKQFSEGSGNISLYTLTQVTIQSFSITSTSQYFLVLTQWACNIFSYWLVEDSAMAALKVH